MDLSDLPEELVEEIANYLSKGDILACSHVNTLWSNAFNVNRIWRRLRKLHPAYFDNYVNKLPLLCDEHFNQYCKEKEQFLKESIVKQNLSNGNFHIAKFDSNSVYCDNLLYVTDNMGNHWLFISCVDIDHNGYKHKLQVFNMNDDPVLHVSKYSPIKLQYKLIDTEMKFENEKLFFFYDSTLLVYEFVYPYYEMNLQNILCSKPEQLVKYRVMVHVSNCILEFYLENEYIHSLKQPNCDVFNDKGLLISSYKCCHFLDEEMIVCSLNAKSNGSDLVVVVSGLFNVGSRRFDFAHIFSVPELDYLQFSAKFISISSFDICGNVVSFLCQTRESTNLKSIFVYVFGNGIINFETNFSVPTKCTDYKLVPGAKEVITFQKRTISVFDISLGIQIRKIKLNGINLTSSVILSDSLLLIEYSDKKKPKYGVWNFKYELKLYELTMDKCHNYIMLKNHNCPTKIIGF